MYKVQGEGGWGGGTPVAAMNADEGIRDVRREPSPKFAAQIVDPPTGGGWEKYQTSAEPPSTGMVAPVV